MKEVQVKRVKTTNGRKETSQKKDGGQVMTKKEEEAIDRSKRERKGWRVSDKDKTRMLIMLMKKIANWTKEYPKRVKQVEKKL